jgi:hypothetical protein
MDRVEQITDSIGRQTRAPRAAARNPRKRSRHNHGRIRNQTNVIPITREADA